MDIKWEDKALGYLKRHPQRWVSAKEMIQALNLERELRPPFRKHLRRLAQEGKLSRIHGNHYRLLTADTVVQGRLDLHPKGFGFVMTGDGDEDVFVPPQQMNAAGHGDRVEVEVYSSLQKRDSRREGRIVKVLERSQALVIGRYERSAKATWVVPRDERWGERIFISKEKESGAKHGHTVLLRILTYPKGRSGPEGEIVHILGKGVSAEVEEKAILLKHGLTEDFPVPVAKQAKEIERAFSQGIPQEYLQDREDLRGQLHVTIDGEKAKDFDDAVSIEKTKGGCKLFVSIADVGAVIPEGTPLDKEARARGTSVYYPDDVIPMFPKPISNNVCSLLPQEDRLTVTMEMMFNQEGERLAQHFYPSVIRSRARLTYQEVSRAYQGDLVGENSTPREVLSQLQAMKALAMKLRNRRLQRGSLNFDLPEPEFLYDEHGLIVNIQAAERNVAHQVIEEFMIAANEGVAETLENRDQPGIYRVHDRPDARKMEEWGHLIKALGYKPSSLTPLRSLTLSKLLRKVEGTSEEQLVNHLLLRCMKQARYSTENVGHFGLASSAYTHFTSPIRRYPDLVVHRMLIQGKQKRFSQGKLAAIAQLSSDRERVAMTVEREMVSLRRVQFMKDYVGQSFSGRVSHLTRFGFYVELGRWFVEGLVRLETLDDDYYIFDESRFLLRGRRRKRIIRLGDEVEVRVVRCDLETKRIDFMLVE